MPVPKQLHTKYTDCCRPILKRFEEASAADDQAEMYSALHDLTSAQIMLLSVPRGGSGSRNRRRNITQVSRNMDSFLARDQQRAPAPAARTRVKAIPRRSFGISRRKKDLSQRPKSGCAGALETYSQSCSSDLQLWPCRYCFVERGAGGHGTPTPIRPTGSPASAAELPFLCGQGG